MFDAEMWWVLMQRVGNHREDGHNNGRNMLVRKLWINFIMNFEVRFVGYINTTDLINARKMERIKTVYVWFDEDWADVYSNFNKH
jgi:hypothetical protein